MTLRLDRIAKNVHRRGLTLFSWQADKDQFAKPEHWTSFIDKYRKGKNFQGDCDDFALTLGEAARDAGVSAAAIAIVICLDETGALHCVLMLGRTWILDNRQRAPLMRSQLPLYTWIKFMSADRPGEWVTFTDQQAADVPLNIEG